MKRGQQAAMGSGERAAGSGLKAAAAGCPFPVADFKFDIAGRSWTISAVSDQDALLAVSENLAAFPFGLMLWESAPVLAEGLAASAERVRAKRVLELGAGVGLCGLVARHLGATHVRQTDHSAEAIALCRANATRNGIVGIEAVEADWTDWHDDATYDVILGSDVLYDREFHATLMRVLDGNLASNGCVLLADPGRPDTPQFMDAMRRARWQLKTTHTNVRAHKPTGPGDSVTITVIEAVRS